MEKLCLILIFGLMGIVIIGCIVETKKRIKSDEWITNDNMYSFLNLEYALLICVIGLLILAIMV